MKNPNAVALGRLGGLKGGTARANKLTSKRRSEIARNAANSRWKKSWLSFLEVTKKRLIKEIETQQKLSLDFKSLSEQLESVKTLIQESK